MTVLHATLTSSKRVEIFLYATVGPSGADGDSKREGVPSRRRSGFSSQLLTQIWKDALKSVRPSFP
jgi:hypothetical protein